MTNRVLSVVDHRRDSAGLVYVYPVVSRRAGGLSVGINLNVNRACNWACVYCQVEGLTKGGPPPIDLELLERELSGFLQQIIEGDYLAKHVPENCRRLADIAFSGDGEPTSVAEFPEVLQVLSRVLDSFGMLGKLPVRLITNGSFMHRAEVQQGLVRLAAMGGEVWFKVDRGDAGGMLAINQSKMSPERVLSNLKQCAKLVPTWVQTCWFAWDGELPGEDAVSAYLELLKQVADGVRGIHLYGLARPSQQPDAVRLGRLSEEEMIVWGRRIEKETGIKVLVSP